MSDAAIDIGYSRVALESSDMVGHMAVLRDHARQCQRVTEFGVYDCTSTWGLLGGHPKWLHSYDIIRRKEVDEVVAVAASSSTNFSFTEASTLDIEIAPTDLLFIDTLHTYTQLKKELELHASKVARYIIMHDTTTFGDMSQGPEGDEMAGSAPGLWLAIVEFLSGHQEWGIKERYTHCHGLTILTK